MKRPLFYLGFGCLITQMLLAMTGTGFAVGWGIASLLLTIPFLWGDRTSLRNRRMGNNAVFVVCFLLCALTCLHFLIRTRQEMEPLTALDGETVELTGCVTEVQTDSAGGSHRCQVRVETCSLQEDRHLPAHWNVRLSSKSYVPKRNDMVQVKGTVYLLGNDSENLRAYYRSRRLYLGLYSFEEVRSCSMEEAGVRDAVRWFRKTGAFFERRREKISRDLQAQFSEPYASVLSGMLTGDKTGIEESEKTLLKRAGVYHLFAVSGFHLSLWSMLLYRLFLSLGVSRRPTCVLSISVALLFLALTGFPKSGIRAAVMLGLFFLGRILLRRPDPLNSLGAAVLLLTLWNPFSGGDVSVLLSVFATFGILLGFSPAMKRVRSMLKRKVPGYRMRKRLEKPLSSVVLSVDALVFTLPVMAFSFGTVSLVSVPANLLTEGAASLAILGAGLGELLAPVPFLRLLSPVLFLGAGLSIRYLLAVCICLAKWPLASFPVGGDWFKITQALILLFLATAIFLLFRMPPIRCVTESFRRTTALLCACLVFSSVLLHQTMSREVILVDFPETRGAETVVVCCSGSAAVIRYGRGKKKTAWDVFSVRSVLEQNGAGRIGTVLDFVGGSKDALFLEELTAVFPPGQILASRGCLDALELPADCETIVCSKKGSGKKENGAVRSLREDAVFEAELFPEVTLTHPSGGDMTLTVRGLSIPLNGRKPVPDQEGGQQIRVGKKRYQIRIVTEWS